MAMDKRLGRPHYSPAEVSLVVNFAPELAVESLRYKFYQQIRDIYGRLLAPEYVQGSTPAFEPYRFLNDDESAVVMLALNSFGYFTSNYTGYDGFRDECSRLANIVKSTFEISELNLVGWISTNIIPFTRSNDKVPLEKLLKIGLKLPKNVQTNLDNLSIRFLVPAKKAGIDVLIERKVKTDSGEEALFLVLSYARAGNLAMEGFTDYLNDAHDQCSDLFSNLISDSRPSSAATGEVNDHAALTICVITCGLL